MLLTLLNWIYIAITCFITGSFTLRIICSGFSRPAAREGSDRADFFFSGNDNIKYTGFNPGSCIVCGLCVLTAYAGYFSLFTGVGLAANIIMLIACICIVAFDRKLYAGYVRDISGRGFSAESAEAFGGEPDSELYEASEVNVSDNPAVASEDINAGLSIKLAGMAAGAAAVFIILICAYFTATGRFAYDTGTYHAQSIHWIESYGVVKGLAYMQTRLGFNSSYFCLCALYSMHFLGQSMHALSGFLGAFVMLYSLRGYYRHASGRMKSRRYSGSNVQSNYADRNHLSSGAIRAGLRVSDFAYFAPFAYFIVTAVEIISPATDHGVIWLIIWLCIRWLEIIEEGRKGMTEYCLLCVMAVFLVSVKLSVGVLALLVIRPAYVLIRKKRTAEIIRYILAGLVLVLPYFIRNVLITGWLIYPFPAVDLFNVDWKIPIDGVRYEADEIVVWARYTRDVAFIDQGIKEWFPVWWSEQGAANRFTSLSAFTGAAVIAARVAISLIYSLYLWLNGRKGRLIAVTPLVKEQSEYVYFGMILLVSFAFFMISAPSNRFGYGYILLIPLFAAGDLVVNIVPLILHGRGYEDGIVRKGATESKGIMLKAAAAVLIIIILCFNMLKGLYMFASDDRHYMTGVGLSSALVRQKDYPQADSGSKEWQGMIIHYPTIEGEQIWYHAFPAILYEGNLPGIERRGDNIRDGFRLRPE